jgi:hypothetical protein
VKTFKKVSSLSLGMPIPVSIILKDTIAFPFCNDSNLVLVVTLPSLVNFSALLTVHENLTIL